MLKKQFLENDVKFIVARTEKMQVEMSKWYNRLHDTTYIPKHDLLVSREENSKTLNQHFFELHTIFREAKGRTQKVKLKMELDTLEQDIHLLELSFIKIKNIKLSPNDSFPDGHSLSQLTEGELNERLISAYLSQEPESFVQEIKGMEGREHAYQHLIQTFLQDIKDHNFILNEIQTEIAKHLTTLSGQLGTTIDEEGFWNSVSSSIAKHYLLPLFIKELVK